MDMLVSVVMLQVLFRTRPKLHSTLVLVKGCEWELPKVKEATMLLVKHMCDNLAVSSSIFSENKTS